MRALVCTTAFVRAAKRITKRHPALSNDIEKALEVLGKNPFAPQLGTHKLKGKLSGTWACSAGYDLRIVFDFVSTKRQRQDDILLLDIGTHDEVY